MTANAGRSLGSFFHREAANSIPKVENSTPRWCRPTLSGSRTLPYTRRETHRSTDARGPEVSRGIRAAKRGEPTGLRAVSVLITTTSFVSTADGRITVYTSRHHPPVVCDRCWLTRWIGRRISLPGVDDRHPDEGPG